MEAGAKWSIINFPPALDIEKGGGRYSGRLFVHVLAVRSFEADAIRSKPKILYPQTTACTNLNIGVTARFNPAPVKYFSLQSDAAKQDV